MASIKQIREKGRERAQKWRDKQKTEGKKSVLVSLPPDAFQVLFEAKKNEGMSYSDTVAAALRSYSAALQPITREIDSIPSVKPAGDQGQRSFVPGDTFRVNHPPSKYHGQIMLVSSYSAPDDTVRCKIDGRDVDFPAEHLEPAK